LKQLVGSKLAGAHDPPIRRTIAWEQNNPPTMINPQQFDYDAEDAALANGE